MKNLRKISVCIFALSLILLASSCTNDRQDTIPIEPPDNSDQIAYDAASAVVGSQLYNDFTKTPGWDAPSDPNVDPNDISDFKDFYRCKQCHAWDRKARFASYINRAPKESRPDVSTVQLVNLDAADISYLFDKVKNTGGAAVDPARTANGLDPSLGGNEHPDYGTIFTDEQIWDVVKFIREGAFDVNLLYDIELSGSYPTGSRSFTNWGKDGDPTLGQTYYSNNCASCHGADGTTLDLGGRSIGAIIREKSYEVQHKILSGQLGTSMGPTPTTLEEMKGLYKYANDTIALPDLPQ